jgi:hypothetical protein
MAWVLLAAFSVAAQNTAAWTTQTTFTSNGFRRHPSVGRLGAAAVHAEDAVSLVWFTGFGDLRATDHPGLALAAQTSAAGSVVPLFLLDDDVHLKSKVARYAKPSERIQKNCCASESNV